MPLSRTVRPSGLRGTVSNDQLYKKLFEAHQKKFGSSLTKSKIQEKCNQCWKELKTSFKGEELRSAAEARAKELHESAARTSAGLLGFFAMVSNFNALN